MIEFPSSVAVSKINEFITYNDINVKNDSYHEKLNIASCDELGIQHLNIHWTPVDYAPVYKRQLAHETDREEICVPLGKRFEDFRSGDDHQTIMDFVDNY